MRFGVTLHHLRPGMPERVVEPYRNYGETRLAPRRRNSGELEVALP